MVRNRNDVKSDSVSHFFFGVLPAVEISLYVLKAGNLRFPFGYCERYSETKSYCSSDRAVCGTTFASSMVVIEERDALSVATDVVFRFRRGPEARTSSMEISIRLLIPSSGPT